MGSVWILFLFSFLQYQESNLDLCAAKQNTLNTELHFQFFKFYFDVMSCQVAPTGLKLVVLLPPPESQVFGSQRASAGNHQESKASLLCGFIQVIFNAQKEKQTPEQSRKKSLFKDLKVFFIIRRKK